MKLLSHLVAFTALAWVLVLARPVAAAESPGFHPVTLPSGSVPAFSEARLLASLPQGRQTFGEVPFLIGEPVLLTGLNPARSGDFFPMEMAGVKLGRAASRLHLLLATVSGEKDGTPLAKLVFHYASGASASVRLGYGVHARDWTAARTEKRPQLFDPNSRLAWAEGDDGRGGALRLFQTAVENPRPDEVVRHIDLVSLLSRAAPLILAVTAEDETPRRPRPAAPPLRKPQRDLLQDEDESFRRELLVRVQDGDWGKGLRSARASLWVQDDKQGFFFGEAVADAEGVCRLPYSPRHTVAYTLWVQAPGRQPRILSESKLGQKIFTQEHRVALRPGLSIGGVIRQPDGKPVAGAEVLISRVTNNSARLYTRVDFDRAVSGPDGRWSSQSLPEDLRGLTFSISHEDFRPALLATSGYAAAPTNASTAPLNSGRRLTEDGIVILNAQPRQAPLGRGTPVPLLNTQALVMSSAEIVLQPGMRLNGVVLNPQGRPVTNLVVTVLRQDLSERRVVRTDGEGKFQARLREGGNVSVAILAEGYAPLFRPVMVRPDVELVEFKLVPARVVNGRVQDRSGRPIAGARVRAEEWNGFPDLLRFQAVTDEQGRFSWTGAPSDQVTYYVSKTNYYNSRSSFSGGMTEITLVLNRAPGVYGRVLDAATRQPVESFFLTPGRKYSTDDKIIRWDRSDGMRGRDGEYALKVDSYYFQPEARVMVEAPGYEPQISPPFRNPDAYTNDFLLSKGVGIGGVVLQPDGTPAPGAALIVAERGDYTYLDPTGMIRSQGSGEVVRSDAQGRFEFPPKLNPDKIYVSHEKGFAEARVIRGSTTNRLQLQPWGRIEGQFRIGDKIDPENIIRLQNRYDRYENSEEQESRLSLYFKADLDASANFTFDRVPPGEHRLALEYRFKDSNYGETPLSHAFNVLVKPGETTRATLGGSGRKVVGRVRLSTGDPSDVDWKRDVHRLTLILPPPPALAPPNMNGLNAPQQQQAWADFNLRQRSFWRTEAGRQQERAERSYVLVFETNGTYRVDNVPPGKYQMFLNVTDPQDEPYNRRTIGSLNTEITVPDEPGAKANQPLPWPDLDLIIRTRLKIGGLVPPFEAKTAEGKVVKLTQFRGKPVLIHFWGLSMGYSTYDLEMLKGLQTAFGDSGKLVILGCNLDQDARSAGTFVKNQRMTWTQTYLGNWSESPVPAMFGLEGNTACLFVDAEGRLQSGQLRGSTIRSFVNNLLQE